MMAHDHEMPKNKSRDSGRPTAPAPVRSDRQADRRIVYNRYYTCYLGIMLSTGLGLVVDIELHVTSICCLFGVLGSLQL